MKHARLLVAVWMLFAGSTIPAAGAAPRPRDARADGMAAAPPAIDIRFDFEAVDRFLDFVSRGRPTPEELQAWVRLPANSELLRQGRLERTLTPDILQEAVKVAVSGGIFDGPPTLGRIDGSDWSVLRRIVGTLEAGQAGLAASAASALRPYLPAGKTLPPLTVRFHLGGSWDGRTTDAVYINLTYFQSRGPDSLPGLDALLVHELFHLAHAALLPAIEDYGSRQSALYTLLLRVEQEGIARHLEYRRLIERSVGTEMDRTNLARYEDGLLGAAGYAAVLSRFQEALDGGRMEEIRRIASEGFHAGGALYAVGHAMAQTIETGAGRDALAHAVVAGPLEFARRYLAAAEAEDRPSLLPATMIDAIGEVERGYGRAPVRASRLRREGLKRLVEGRPGDAVEVLEDAVRIDPSDATSAYNMACAWALMGRERKSLRWLETSFARGFSDYKHAANDEDLVILRDNRAFEDLLRAHGVDYRRPGAGKPPSP